MVYPLPAKELAKEIRQCLSTIGDVYIASFPYRLRVYNVRFRKGMLQVRIIHENTLIWSTIPTKDWPITTYTGYPQEMTYSVE